MTTNTEEMKKLYTVSYTLNFTFYIFLERDDIVIQRSLGHTLEQPCDNSFLPTKGPASISKLD